ncbi:hypothetical protein T492DRAFT_917278 [Pavlovales sp. CCMP2436]|nr:hypothetical protein T492DRAFT_917278 [Pavlovales sp. CCMP2436]
MGLLGNIGRLVAILLIAYSAFDIRMHAIRVYGRVMGKGCFIDAIDLLLVETPPDLSSLATLSLSAMPRSAASFRQPRAVASSKLAPLPPLRHLAAAQRRRTALDSPALSEASDSSTVLDFSGLSPGASSGVLSLSTKDTSSPQSKRRVLFGAENVAEEDNSTCDWLAEHLVSLRGADARSLSVPTHINLLASSVRYPSGMAELRARRERAARSIQRVARAALARCASVLAAAHHVAAIRVQARFRANQSFARLARLRASPTPPAASLSPARAERLARSIEGACRQRAAGRLQVGWRAACALALELAAAQQCALERAAERICAGARGRAARRATQLYRAQGAAVRVQTVLRGNTARARACRLVASARERIATRLAAAALRRHGRAQLLRRRLARSSAAQVLQCGWRRLAAVRGASHILRGAAALRVQAHWRGLLARAVAKRRGGLASDSIGCAVRAAAQLTAARKTRALCTEATLRARSCALRGCFQRATFTEWRAESCRLTAARWAVAAKLQAVWRGNVARAIAHRTLLPASALDLSSLSLDGRSLQAGAPSRLDAAATAMQARVRGNCARGVLLRARIALENSSHSLDASSVDTASPLPRQSHEPTQACEASSTRAQGDSIEVEAELPVTDARQVQADFLAALRAAAGWER